MERQTVKLKLLAVNLQTRGNGKMKRQKKELQTVKRHKVRRRKNGTVNGETKQRADCETTVTWETAACGATAVLGVNE